MSTVAAIVRREFAAYFNTALGWIILVYLLTLIFLIRITDLLTKTNDKHTN